MERPPYCRDACCHRGHRYLGPPARNEARESHAQRMPLSVEYLAGKREPEAASEALHTGRYSRIRGLEAEAVPSLDRAHLFIEAAGEEKQPLLVAIRRYEPADTPRGVGSQRRGYKEPFRFEVEVLVHRSKYSPGVRAVVPGILATLTPHHPPTRRERA